MEGRPDSDSRSRQALRILNVTRLASPGVVLIVFIVSFLVYGVRNAPDAGDQVQIHAMRGPGGRPLPTRRKSANQVREAVAVKDLPPSAKLLFRVLQTIVIISFLINAAAIIAQTLLYRSEQWWPGQSPVIYMVGSLFAWTMVLISLVDTKPSPTWVHSIVWSAAVPLEVIIVGASLQIYSHPHHEPMVGDQFGGRLHSGPTGWEILEVIVHLVRTGVLLSMAVIFGLYKAFGIWHNKSKDTEAAGERRPLLNGASNANGNARGYDSADGHQTEQKPQQDAWAKPTETPNMTWYAYIRGFYVLIPYLWPKKSRKLQALAMTCFLIMIAQRAVNLSVPVLTGAITNALTGTQETEAHVPWALIGLYIGARWLQGGQGLLGAVRSILWIPVEQYSYRAISTAAFEHVHGLSAEFHTGKRTGELISALNKGSSINSFLEMVTFNVGPMIFDLVVAIVYLSVVFDIYLALVVTIVTFAYVYVTIRLAAWRVTLRRNYTNADREMEAVKNDSLHSWDTVKYFNAEQYEFARYRDSIKSMQRYEYWVNITLAYMNTIQGMLFMVALLIACFIEAFQVAQGLSTVGQFITLTVYMAQLQGPLNFFGTFYRSIQNNLINAERMLELFKEQPHVIDKDDAQTLDQCVGDIVFDNVTFGYDKNRPALNGLSFRCAPGTTTALVGESGGGKTTVMRLLFRYYNPDSGEIRIDGNKVEDLTIDSVRKHISVVPQDCNMFNETLMYNLRYANQYATDEDIYDACRAASIHNRILEFRDGYNTKVGERGVRLSGGERQRVAIARTILKNPKITLLDEATAALDTETEERIQKAFDELAIGRTMLMIAHRLSTITNADQILVLSGGSVVEKGTHAELISKGGKYASMWRKQSRALQAAAEAEELRTRADRTLEAAEVDSANVSEDEVDRAILRRDKSASSFKALHGSGSKKLAMLGHKRVNFSQSSLGKGFSAVDEDDAPKGTGGSDSANGTSKSPGHP